MKDIVGCEMPDRPAPDAEALAAKTPITLEDWKCVCRILALEVDRLTADLAAERERADKATEELADESREHARTAQDWREADTELHTLRAELTAERERADDLNNRWGELSYRLARAEAALEAERGEVREWRRLFRESLDEYGHLGCCDGGPAGEPCDVELCRRGRELTPATEGGTDGE